MGECSGCRRGGNPRDTWTDSELLRDAQRGGLESMEILVRRYAVALEQYLTLRTGSRTEAQDLAQETWLRVWRFIARVDPDRPFRPWLFRVATRVVASGYRRRDQHLSLDEDTLATLVVVPNRASDYDREEVAELWQRAAVVLSARQREALWLFYMEEMTIPEVATAMGVPQGLVKVWLHRARTRLAREIPGGNHSGDLSS